MSWDVVGGGGGGGGWNDGGAVGPSSNELSREEFNGGANAYNTAGDGFGGGGGEVANDFGSGGANDGACFNCGEQGCVFNHVQLLFGQLLTYPTSFEGRVSQSGKATFLLQLRRRRVSSCEWLYSL